MLYDLWLDTVRRHGGETALWDLAAGRRWRFRDLAESVERSAPCSRPIAYPQGKSAEFILTLLQAWRAGAITCPLELDQTPPAIPHPPSGCQHLKLTSATSGAARMVAFTEAQLAADARNLVETMGLHPERPNLGTISLAHSYGFSNLVLPLLLHGIPLILAPSALPEMVRQAAAEPGAPGAQTPLTLAAVPILWRAWHEAGAIPPNVVLAISAGAPLTIELEQAIHADRGLKIHNFYGSSECGGIAYDDTLTPRQEEGLVGRAVRNVDLAVNEEGCLQVGGAAVGETYWPAPDDALADGRFQTGDLAEIRDGAVYLRGRVGDLMNVAGRKLSPGAIERILRAHPAVKECLVFGVPASQAERTDRIVACVVTEGPRQSEPLKQFLLRRLPAWQVPRDWWFVDSLTTNTRGKISRAEWRRKYAARQIAGTYLTRKTPAS